ncbi:MAG: hypothetical protein Q8L55_15915 [Phycisphaerales bacterium]|nr:hypothetical protein [Phycisphaerales bacterium]
MAKRPHPTDNGNGTPRYQGMAEGGGRTFWVDGRFGGDTRAKRGDKTIWTTKEANRRSRAQRCARRNISTASDRPIWCDREGRIVARLHESGLGCRLVAHRASDGKPLWSRLFRLPPAAPFAKRVRDTDKDEATHAFLTDTPDALALAIQHSTPDSGLGAFTLPFAALLTVRGIDKHTGEVLWQSEFPDAYLDICDRSLYEGLHATLEGAWSLDFKTGRAHQLHAWKAWAIAVPRRIGPNVVLAWSHRSGTSIRIVNEKSAAVIAAVDVPRSPKYALDIKHAGGVAVVNIDTHHYIVLGPAPTFTPSPLLKIKGYFDALTAERRGVVCINARYWLVRVNASKGQELSRARPTQTRKEREAELSAFFGLEDDKQPDARERPAR